MESPRKPRATCQSDWATRSPLFTHGELWVFDHSSRGGVTGGKVEEDNSLPKPRSQESMFHARSLSILSSRMVCVKARTDSFSTPSSKSQEKGTLSSQGLFCNGLELYRKGRDCGKCGESHFEVCFQRKHEMVTAHQSNQIEKAM